MGGVFKTIGPDGKVEYPDQPVDVLGSKATTRPMRVYGNSKPGQYLAKGGR